MRLIKCQKNLQMNEFRNLQVPILPRHVQDTVINQLDALNTNNRVTRESAEGYRKVIEYYIFLFFFEYAGTRHDVARGGVRIFKL